MCLSGAHGYDSPDLLAAAATRFWLRVEKGPDCWRWTGTYMTAGYGELSYRGKKMGAHRFSFLLHIGELSAGMCICHKCNNRACVNPTHLYQGSYRNNYDDILRRLQDEHIPDLTPQNPNFWDFLDPPDIEAPTCPTPLSTSSSTGSRTSSRMGSPSRQPRYPASKKNPFSVAPGASDI